VTGALPDRARGTLLGLAVGDALGTTLELERPGTFSPIDDTVGGGPFGLVPGQWTDDTSMALCLVESLIECRRFDPLDQLRRYVRWWREGQNSVTGSCFDIGNTVQDALARFEQTRNPWSGSTNASTAGNGSLMRLAPVPLFFAHDPVEAIARAGDSSRTTHGAPEAVDACRYFASLIVGALQGRARSELLSPMFSPVENPRRDAPLALRIEEIARGSLMAREPPAIRGTGYVVDSLEAALWAFAKSRSFEDGALLAVNLGNDADTTGAVYGRIAGAFYGLSGIPDRWLAKLHWRDQIDSLASQLVAGSDHHV
jgi:ADP-ribosylglycohydrolase